MFDLATGDHIETYKANTDAVYGYDNQGRLTTATVDKLNSQTLSTPLVTSYTYDAAGNEKTETLPDGEVTTYSYDDLNRLVELTEVQGSTSLFGQIYVLHDDGTRASSREIQRQADGSIVIIDSVWTYDALQRLTSEAVTSTGLNESYTNGFNYDLDNNRMQELHTGPGGGDDDTITYLYNGDDELISQTSDLSGTTVNEYDANGSLTTSTAVATGQSTTYTYDVRNKMVGYADGTNTATYVYDNDGDRVAETATTSGTTTTTLFLTDTQNPTGYDQPIEQRASATASPSVTYVLGDRVLGQADVNSNVSYLLTDGHGSTQEIISSTGGLTAFRYDAFGDALNFNPATAIAGGVTTGTVFLFGGDAIYDPISGLYFHGDGERPTYGFLFIQRDTYAGNTQDPVSLHKYLYAGANSITYHDFNGHYFIGSPVCSSFGELLITETIAANVEVPYNATVIAEGDVAEEGATAEFGVEEEAIDSALNEAGEGTQVAPQQAEDALETIKTTGSPPSGYKGGGTFANDGRGGGQVLDQFDSNGNPITYKEFDVNPYVKGVNRGPERIVIGSDGRAYYTATHYNDFVEM